MTPEGQAFKARAARNRAANAARAEQGKATEWWRSLSLNEQKSYAKEVLGVLWEYAWGVPAHVLRIWKAKAAN